MEKTLENIPIHISQPLFSPEALTMSFSTILNYLFVHRPFLYPQV